MNVIFPEPDKSMLLMEKARKFNRLRMKDVEHYSHVLFIEDQHVKMRLLMDDIFEAGRYTPECSIALGEVWNCCDKLVSYRRLDCLQVISMDFVVTMIRRFPASAKHYASTLNYTMFGHSLVTNKSS